MPPYIRNSRQKHLISVATKLCQQTATEHTSLVVFRKVKTWEKNEIKLHVGKTDNRTLEHRLKVLINEKLREVIGTKTSNMRMRKKYRMRWKGGLAHRKEKTAYNFRCKTLMEEIDMKW